MKGPGYLFTEDHGQTLFEFESEGPRGTITKVVWFARIAPSMWNLSFGDKADDPGQLLLDTVVSNNGDLRRVIQTVVNITYTFLENHPGEQLVIYPVDQRRRSLYNHLVRRHWPVLRYRFFLFGLREDYLESYQPGNSYDAFFLSLKSGIFEA